MNERIRELQSKSYLMCKQIVDDDGHVVVTPDQWFDKFAELLVRECMDVVRQEWYDENNKEPVNDARSIAIHVGTKSGLLRATNAVAKHFGVER